MPQRPADSSAQRHVDLAHDALITGWAALARASGNTTSSSGRSIETERCRHEPDRAEGEIRDLQNGLSHRR